ncbi:MAG: pentapeptide repeat-containing protein, partial [Nitrospirales bacterium]|nr:pentapeptide repeat-containing protein [Nitrospirales bacterium]
FQDTDLYESDFQQANLNGTTFLNAQTTGANFQSSLGLHKSSMTDSSPPFGDPLFP